MTISNRADDILLEFPSFERCNVGRCQFEPFSIFCTAIGEATMPVRFDTGRIIGLDRGNQCPTVRKAGAHLLYSPFKLVAPPDLVIGAPAYQVNKPFSQALRGRLGPLKESTHEHRGNVGVCLVSSSPLGKLA